MRIALATRPSVLFGAMLVAALLATLPMRLVLGAVGLGDQGLVAREVRGSVWAATLSEARFGDVTLGDLDARLSPWALMTGQARLGFAAADGAASPVRGVAVLSRHGYAAEAVTAHVATGRLFAPLPVTALDLDAVSVRFADGRCTHAEGRIRATIAGDAGGIALPPTMSGTARCEGAALLLPLASQAGTESVALVVRGDGRYRAQLRIVPADPLAGERLQRLGFVVGAGGSGSGYGLSVEGRF